MAKNSKDVKNVAKDSQQNIYGNIFLRIVLFVVFHAISIILLILAIVYFKDCRIQPKIPIILIVYSVLNLIAGTLLEIVNCMSKDGEHSDTTLALQCIAVICMIGSFVSFVLCCVWVYGIAFPENYECHAALYITAFVFITIVLVLIIIVIVIVCCICCCVLFGAGTALNKEEA